MQQGLRLNMCSGRTTRMLKEVAIAVTEGKEVLIVFSTMRMVKHFRKKYPWLSEFGGQLLMKSLDQVGFNPYACTVKLEYRSRELFIDHGAIEWKFKDLLKALRRWDGE